MTPAPFPLLHLAASCAPPGWSRQQRPAAAHRGLSPTPVPALVPAGVAVALSVVLATGLLAPIGAEPATPQRPSYSSDTNTTAPGTFEIELGFATDQADSRSTPVSLKWGAADRTELFLGWTPYLHVEGLGFTEDGPGDLVAGARVRVMDEEPGHPSAALQLATKLPTADDAKGLGSGELDFFGAGILTKSVDRATVVAFYQLGVLSEATPGETALEHGAALAVGHPIAGDLGGFVELAGIFVPDAETESVFATFGLGWSVEPSVILDAAVAVGLSDEASDWSLTVGGTANLGRLGR